MLTVDYKGKNTVFIGIGNAFKSDESVGLYIANHLENDDILVLSAEYRFEDCMNDMVLINPDLMIIADAADFEGEPGDVRQWSLDDIRDNGFITNQDYPLHESIDILKEKMPDMEVIILGIKGASKADGEILTEKVKKTAKAIINDLS